MSAGISAATIAGGLAAGVGGTLAASAIGGGGGGGGAGQVLSGVGNVAGGALSANEAQQFAQTLASTANPFGPYNAQFGKQLADATTAGTYGNATPSSVTAVGNYANNTTLPLTGALNGSSIGSQLMNLVNNPSSVFSTPQYQAAFGQGQNAVNSTLAAQGLDASGNQLAALQNYGQSFGANYYGNMLSQLSGLYGQSLQANQQGFNQLTGAAQLSTSANNQAFNQLALLSGALTGSPTAAAQAMAPVFANVNAAYGSVGQGIGQIGSGVGNLLNGLGGSTGSGGFDTGLGTTTSGFGDVSGSGGLFGTSAGLGGDGFTLGGGGNSFGFTM